MKPRSAAPSTGDGKRLEWYRRARFGMFIHWGVYSVPASGECLAYRAHIPHEEYRRYAAAFRAERYRPEEWAALAREAGMRYMVLTARHLDGFCLFNTKTTDFCATRIGPQRDLVAPFVAACRQAGLKVGLYYNLRDLSDPAYDYGPGDRRWKPHVRRVHTQFEEILTQYGRIDVLWIDQTSSDPTFMKAMEVTSLGQMIRRLQPEMVVSRACGAKGFGDFDIHEKHASGNLQGRLWELCDTFNQNWGYHALDKDWKSVLQMACTLATCAHSGGNYLLNVGPKPDGVIPAACVSRLRAIGRWTARNAAAIYDVEPHPFDFADQTLSVARGNIAYIFMVDGQGCPHRNRPQDKCVIAGIGNRVRAACFLGDPAPLAFAQKEDRLILDLPRRLPDRVLAVLKLELDGKPRGLRTRWWHCGIGPLERAR